MPISPRTASHHVQANAYLSPPNAAGLNPHRDLHDVIVVQLEGDKCWDVEGLGEVRLGEGDVLYLPAGRDTRPGRSTTTACT